jgi:threonine dehydrogenase-like Zn-dependent dehydrogenase
VVQEDWAGRRLPPSVDPMVGIFSRLGAIALKAILDADVHLSEYVAVFGHGVPGLIASRLGSCKASEQIMVS